MANPGPASSVTEHPLYGGGGPAYLGTSTGNIGFYQDPYAGGAVPQRQSAVQAVLNVSQTAGIIAVFTSNSQNLGAISANNVSVVQVTVTGAPQVSTADVVIVNKATPVAGFGIGSVRVSTASPAQNTAIFFVNAVNTNVSGASTVSTAGDSFIFTAIRGSVVNSIALAPPVVPAQSTIEAQFTVTGVAPGMVVAVTKPTEQANLAVGNVRVVSNNVLGIQYMNVGNTAITPASETYSWVGMQGAVATTPYYAAGVNMSQVATSLLTVTSGSIATVPVTVTGINQFDQAIGTGQSIKPPLSQVALVGAQVSSAVANIIGLQFMTLSAAGGTGTATSTDTYLIPMLRQNLEAPLTVYPGTFPGATIGPNTTTEVAVTVTGITVSCAVLVSKPSYTSGATITGYRVSAAATTGSIVGITFSNPSSVSVVLPSETYQIGAFKPLLGQGHYTEQLISQINVNAVALSNEMRNTLAGVNLFQGF